MTLRLNEIQSLSAFTTFWFLKRAQSYSKSRDLVIEAVRYTIE